MNDDFKVTDEQTEAALRVLRAAGIDTAELAKAVIEIAYALQTAIEAAAEIIRQLMPPITEQLSEIMKMLEESGVFDDEPRARRQILNRERARLIESRYRVKIRHYERSTPYRRIYKPP